MNSRIIFTIFLFLFIIIISVLKTENFVVNKIIAEDELANEEYHKCMNENSELYYKTNGKYNSCYNILNNLTNWGLSTNTNLGNGSVQEMCPISSLKKMPSACLEKHINNQYQTIEDINKLISDTTSNEGLYRAKIETGINYQKDYLDNVYNNQDIIEVINYLYLNGYPVSDSIYNSILNKRRKEIIKTQENSPTTTTLTPQETTLTPPEITLTPQLTQPAIIFSNNANMALSSKSNSSGLLGY